MHATPPKHGMASIQQWPKDPEATFAYEGVTGKDLEVASVPSTTSNMFAQDAVLPLTELMAVLRHRKHKALAPHHPDEWEYMLQKVELTQKYPNVVGGLHFSFNISFPSITTTQAPPNNESVIEFSQEFDKIAQSEIQKG